MPSKVDDFLVHKNMSVKLAMRQMGRVGERILFVVNDDNQLIGSLTDGDIRRWVLKNGNLQQKVFRICNKNPVSVNEQYDKEKIKKLMLKRKIPGLSVVNNSKTVCGVLLWNKIFGNGTHGFKEKLEIPVVIMAGGKGTRLDPFTKVLPKPLIPIGDKTIIEIIMDRYYEHGVREFYLTINHKSKMIKAFFEEMGTRLKIHYVEETMPLGTAGSLRFMENKVEDYLMVSNCDIIIKADYVDILEYHKKNKYDITLVGSFRHFTIPYGICHMGNGGSLIDIEEKPEYDYLVNTGMYCLSKNVLSQIPRNRPFDITDLIKKVKNSGGGVGVFPVDEKSWIDVGQWEEYRRAIKHLEFDA